MELLHLPKYAPKYLMGDAHRGICRARTTFLPSTSRIQCYYHLKTNVANRRSLLPTPATDWVVVNQQIWQLHQAPSQRVFDVASELLIREWNNKGWSAFASDFEKNCLKDSIKW